MKVILWISEDECLDLASGYVPLTVKAQARDLLDYRRQDERRAERPVKPAKKPTGGRAAPPQETP